MAKTLRLTATALVIGVVGLAVATLLVPRALGWTPYVVTSGSMSPSFEPGALIASAPIDVDEIHHGDILTFNTEGGLTTHRVVEVSRAVNNGETDWLITTKGDANEENDPTPLDPRNIVGKAKFAVPYVGYAVNFAKTPAGAGILAVILLLLVFTSGGRTTATDSPKTRETAVTS